VTSVDTPKFEPFLVDNKDGKVGDVDWATELGKAIATGSDAVDVAHIIRRLSTNRSEQYVGANKFREICGLSIPQTIEVLAWMADERTDGELRRAVNLSPQGPKG
jgi:hypothetical protein